MNTRWTMIAALVMLTASLGMTTSGSALAQGLVEPNGGAAEGVARGRPGRPPSRPPGRPVHRTALSGGSLLFVSDRSGTPQVWLKDDISNAVPPRRMTYEPNGARSPHWTGVYQDEDRFAYITRVSGRDVIRFARPNATTGSTLVWGYDPAAPMAGPALSSTFIYGLAASNGSNKTTPALGPQRLCFAHFTDWSSRGLACLHFGTSAGPKLWHGTYVVEELVGVSNDPAPSDISFSSDNETIYFSADRPSGRGYMYSVPAAGGPATSLSDSTGALLRLAFAPFVMRPDTTDHLIWNSETESGDPAHGEELRKMTLPSAPIFAVTDAPGNQYGQARRISWNGFNVSHTMFVMQSNARLNPDLVGLAPGAIVGNYDLFRCDYDDPDPNNGLGSTCYVKIDIADPDNLFNDGMPDWR